MKSTPLTPPRRADPRQSTKSFWQCVFLIGANHKHQCEQGERKKPSIGLPENWQAVDGLFVVLSTGEFELCVSPKTPKSGEFASPVRYFYFTPPDFSNVRKLFLIALSFLILYAKIQQRSAGFLSASFLPMQVGGATATNGEHPA